MWIVLKTGDSRPLIIIVVTHDLSWLLVLKLFRFEQSYKIGESRWRIMYPSIQQLSEELFLNRLRSCWIYIYDLARYWLQWIEWNCYSFENDCQQRFLNHRDRSYVSMTAYGSSTLSYPGIPWLIMTRSDFVWLFKPEKL